MRYAEYKRMIGEPLDADTPNDDGPHNDEGPCQCDDDGPEDIADTCDCLDCSRWRARRDSR
jgi:hypothetical protein